MRLWLFWLTVFAGAIALQGAFPGVDVLAAGLILAMQKENAGRILLIVTAAILIQEGAGSLDFGIGILIYGLLGGGFVVGRQVFASESVLFVILLGLWHGVAVSAGTGLLAGLQGLTLPQREPIGFLALQCVVVLVTWAVFRWMYPAREPSSVGI